MVICYFVAIHICPYTDESIFIDWPIILIIVIVFGHSLSILIHIQILKYDIAFECTNEVKREKEPFRAHKILICIVILIGMFNFIKFYGYFQKTGKKLVIHGISACVSVRASGGNGREVMKTGCTMNEFYESVDFEGYDLVIVLFAGVSVCCSFVFVFEFGSFSTKIKVTNGEDCYFPKTYSF